MQTTLDVEVKTGEFGSDGAKRTRVRIFPDNDGVPPSRRLPCVYFFLDEMNVTIKANADAGDAVLREDIQFVRDALEFVSNFIK